MVVDPLPFADPLPLIIKGRDGLQHHLDPGSVEAVHDFLQICLELLLVTDLEQVIDTVAHHDDVVVLGPAEPHSVGGRIAGSSVPQTQIPVSVVLTQFFRQHRIPVDIGVHTGTAALGDGIAQKADALFDLPVTAQHRGKGQMLTIAPAIFSFDI